MLKQFAEALNLITDQLLFGDRKSYALASIKDLELVKMENLDEKQKETVEDLYNTVAQGLSPFWLLKTWKYTWFISTVKANSIT